MQKVKHPLSRQLRSEDHGKFEPVIINVFFLDHYAWAMITGLGSPKITENVGKYEIIAYNSTMKLGVAARCKAKNLQK